MKSSPSKLDKVLFFILLPVVFSAHCQAFGSEFPDGAKPLISRHGKPLKTFVPEGTLFLKDPEILAIFFKKLGGSPPD